MRAVIQRVSQANVKVEGSTISSMKEGLLVLLGVEHADTADDADWLAAKIVRLRVFNDENGLMNLSVLDVSGELIVVSQFTLFASTKKGNRPSYIKSAPPDHAIPLYDHFVAALEQQLGKKVGTGKFGAMMSVSLVNDGPVTILIDSRNKE